MRNCKMIHYEFPVIKHLDDVKSVLSKPEFSLVQKDGYQVLSYNFMDSNTFTKPIEAECRGLIFDMKGNLISRRFHKFFNLGERQDSVPDLTKPHVILEKLDGSMVSPIPFDVKNGYFRLGTKMGITDVSNQAEEWTWDKQNYIKFMLDAMSQERTPIFEWCSRKQKIVLDYPEDSLVLLAVRSNLTGEYLPYSELQWISKNYDIPLVKTFEGNLGNVKALENSEGVVIRFEDGHMVKLKSEWYVRIHRAVADMASERNILQLMFDEQIDDRLPLLPEDLKNKVVTYRDSVVRHMVAFTEQIFETYQRICALSGGLGSVNRKDFALQATKEKYAPILFKLLDGQSDIKAVIGYIKRKIKHPDEIRDIIGPAYKEFELDE